MDVDPFGLTVFSIQSLMLSKSRYDNVEDAKAAVKQLGFSTARLTETDTVYIFGQRKIGDFDKEKLLSYQLKDGVQLIVGVPVEKPETEEKSISGNRLKKDEIELLLSLEKSVGVSGEPEMSDKDKKTETPVDDKKKSEDGTEKKQPSIDEVADVIASRVSKNMEEILKPVSESLSSVGKAIAKVAEVAGKLDEHLKSVEGQTEDKTEKEADDDKKSGDSEKSDDAVTELHKSVKELAEKITTISKSIPDQPDRDEKIDKDKKTDPNDCFDGSGVFPFTTKAS
jgi:hypothetical protein